MEKNKHIDDLSDLTDASKPLSVSPLPLHVRTWIMYKTDRVLALKQASANTGESISHTPRLLTRIQLN